MEVFLGELFGGVAGGVDDADGCSLSKTGTAREFIQRVLVRAWGRRLGPVTTRVGWEVRSTSSTALLVGGRERERGL